MKQKNQKNPTKPIIGISIGDVNGIGPEVTIGALSDNRILKTFIPVIYASAGVISYYRKQMDIEQFNYHQCDSITNINPKKINVINCWSERVNLTPGTGNQESGQYARISLIQATEDLKASKLDGLVTAPLSKEHVKNEEFDFPGHTEYLTEAFEAKDSLMLMMLDSLRVGVVTGHMPLKEVSHKLTKELIKSKTEILLTSLKNDFEIQKPKVALLGLNPHAGENGILGNEEQGIITPVIEELSNKGNIVIGPFPADGFFGSGQFKNFDAVLAMYHDQGLIPFKTLTGGEGVNFTAGIPKIRTSPAHGTAYNLAGKNVADATSMRNALYAAIDLASMKLQQEEH